jgi:C1A family cysteine protease
MKYSNINNIIHFSLLTKAMNGILNQWIIFTICFILITLHFVPEAFCLETPDMHVAPVNPAFQKYIQSLPQEKVTIKRNRSARLRNQASNLGFIPDPVIPEKHLPDEYPVEQLQSHFDLRDPNNDGNPSDSPLPPIRQQGSCGACWTFATYGSLETHLNQSYQLTMDFSENHLRYNHGFDLSPCAGGNLKMSVAYLVFNKGPVLEADDPYTAESSESCQTCPPSRYIDNAVFLPVRSTLDDIAYIKQAIITYGALYSAMFMDQAKYYNATYHTYYYDDPDDSFDDANHAVVIVGWNDQMTVSDAPGPGVFIVRNSLGETWGDAGYFYVSYFDESIAMSRLGFFQDIQDENHAFDTIYQYDQLGWTGGIGTGDGKDWAANVFTASEDIDITAIGFYATQSATTYHIQIYDNFEDLGGYGRPSGPMMDNIQTGFLSHAGYYYIPLDQSVNVLQGKNFAVTVAFEADGNAYPIPIEKPIENYASQATAKSKESYVSDYGDMYFDLKNFSSNSNVCIKAYAIKQNKMPPVADEKYIETDEDTAVSIRLTGTSFNAQDITFIIRSYPIHGSLSGSLPNLIYTPDTDYNGDDAFTVQVNDGFATSMPATIQINIDPVNDPPIAWPMHLVALEDTGLPLASLGMDTDGDIMTFNLLSPPANGMIIGDFSDLVYMPSNNYNGNDSFTFQLNDALESSLPATITLTVEAVNDPPCAENQTLYVLEDTFLDLTLTGMDIDNDQLTYAILSQPQHGQLTGHIPFLTYIPAPDFFGMDKITYQINDSKLLSDPITIEIHVTNVDDNNPPVARNQTFLIYADQCETITLSATDTDNDVLAFKITSLPKHGLITGSGPVFQYTPTNPTALFDQFVYHVNDGQIDSNLATIRLLIIQANHAPTANNKQIETISDTSVSFTLTASDPDNDSLSWFIASNPLHGRIDGNLPVASYVPSDGYSGTDIFTYYVNDGSKSSAYATVYITIHEKPSETRPNAFSQSIQLAEDTAVSITLTGYDPNVNALNYYIKSQPLHGQLFGELPLIQYQPDTNYIGTDIFYYQTGNGHELSDIVPITLTIIPVNDVPVVQNQTVVTGKNQPVAITLTVSDPDSETFDYAIVQEPQYGMISGNAPYLYYTPDIDYVGTVSLTFTASDGQDISNPAIITINVLPFQVIEDDPQIHKEEFIAPSVMSSGGFGNSIPNSNKGKVAGDSNVRVNIANRSMAIFMRLTVP